MKTRRVRAICGNGRSCHGPSAPWPARPKTARKKKPATPVEMTENPRAAWLRSGVRAGGRRRLQRQEKRTVRSDCAIGEFRVRRPARSRRYTGGRGKPRRRVGASQEAETRVLDGRAKFAGTCPLVQVILAGANERRGLTQPSRSRGVEPECQM
jgi:hypothetical protein